MTQDSVVSICVSAMELAMKVAMPLLLVGLIVGLLVSIFQAVTQIQEATLAFVPKAIAVSVALLVCGHWMITEAVDFTEGLFAMIPTYLGDG